jgi:hypothetical protein
MDPKNLTALKTLGRISRLPHKQPTERFGVTKLDLHRAALNSKRPQRSHRTTMKFAKNWQSCGLR